ncbi:MULTISPECIES: DapH/DapD/GlmU-related protein [unclassified Pseudofrankia]|uniref:acyltransferase n=1 Tax=unclassified Pseudofrankia TaxID=2994372 RepID=UPI0008DAC696|nr:MULTISPECIES: acyltransferase [unclassified Pseudofrankia]MDT3443501.1 acyltransferase [Pseudofrankia sp. BMG5.37]OHV42712.1 transferase [Pseudofrankia sp. BMG5.36]
MAQRLVRALRSVFDVRVWAHLFRLVHFYGYSHVLPRARVTMGQGVRMAPNVSIRNGERITIGAGAHIGERCYLWAGDDLGQIDIGEKALFGPEVFITASNYMIKPGTPVMDQPKIEKDVRIGRDVWLGARTVVLAGVTVGDGCIIAAGAVITRSVPPNSIVAGVPARVIGMRTEPEEAPTPVGVSGTVSGPAASPEPGREQPA